MLRNKIKILHLDQSGLISRTPYVIPGLQQPNSQRASAAPGKAQSCPPHWLTISQSSY